MQVDQEGPVLEAVAAATNTVLPAEEAEQPATVVGQPAENVAQPEGGGLSDEEAGQILYARLLAALFAELKLYADREHGLLDPVKQLLVYHHAAIFFEARDAVMDALKTGETADASLPDAYQRAIVAVRNEMQAAGTWPRPSALRGKRVFGHRHAIRSLQLPNLPKGTWGLSVYLRQRPLGVVEEQAREATSLLGDLIKFEGSKDPLGDLDTAGLVLVLALGDLDPGAHVVISPFIARAEDAAPVGAASRSDWAAGTEARKRLMAFIGQEAGDWQRVLAGEERQLLTASSLRSLRQALKSSVATEAAQDFLTPQKPLRQGRAKVEARGRGADVPTDGPESAGRLQQLAGLQAGPKAYAALISRLFGNLGFYHPEDPEWLDPKKQLLIYHHAAKLAEEREAIISTIRGDEEMAVSLPEAHRQTVSELRGELVELLAATGEKAKRIFAHEHVIRFHQPPKGLPVSRSACIFLRELPQVSGYRLKQTPSLFRDLVRFKCVSNSLTMLEEHGLGLVLNVTDRTPRAFLVISPLFERPEIVEQALTKNSWAEMEQALKEHLVALITKDGESWLSFIQRHADVMTKESLRIIQRALKGHKPLEGASSGLGKQVQETAQAREEASMMAADAEGRCGALEALMAARAEEAEERQRSFEERQAALSASLAEREDEAESLVDANQELLQSLEDTRLKAAERKEKLRSRLGKLNVLKHQLKDAQHKVGAAEQAQTELTLKAEELRGLHEEAESLREQVQDAEERLRRAEHSAAKAQQAAEQAREQAREQVKEATGRTATAERSAAEAWQAEAKALGELSLKTDTVERLTALNVELRAEATKAKQDAAAAEQDAAEKRTTESRLRSEFKRKEEAFAAAEDECSCLREEATKAVEDCRAAEERASKAELAATEARGAEVRARAECQIQAGELARLTVSCVDLRSEVEQAKERERQADDRTAASERSVIEVQQAEIRARAELEVKIQTAAQLIASNTALRAEAAQAREQEEAASERAAAAERDATEARTAGAQVHDDLTAKSREAAELSSFCEALRTRADDAEAEARRQRELAEAADVEHIRVRAQLQVNVEEAARLGESCASLRTELEAVREDALQASARASLLAIANAELQEAASKARETQKQASERAEAAERAASEAQQAQIRARAELEVKTETASQLVASNTLLRAEAALAKEQEDSASERATRVEQALVELQSSEAETQASLRAKAEEAAAFATECKTLKAEVAQASEEMRKAVERASEGQSATVRARAECQAKAEQASRLEASCSTLHTQVATLEEELRGAKAQATEAEHASAESRKVELQARAELEVKATTVSQLTATNAALRTIAAQATDAEALATKRADEAEARAAELQSIKMQALTDLRAKSEEVKSCAASRDASRAEAAEAVLAAQQAAERAVAAERTAAESRAAELKACAELQVKTEEASHLGASCVALRTKVSALREEAAQNSQRVDTAEQAREEAVRVAAQAHAELQLKSDTIAQLSASNTALRVEVAASRQETVEAQKRAASADEATAEAQDAASQACAELRAKAAEVAKLKGSCTGLHTELAAVSKKVGQADQRTMAAEEAATTAKKQEARAKAQLQVNEAELVRLEASCTDFATKAAATRLEAARAMEQAAASHRTELEVRAQLAVALEASELSVEEVRRLAAGGRQERAVQHGACATPAETASGGLASMSVAEPAVGEELAETPEEIALWAAICSGLEDATPANGAMLGASISTGGEVPQSAAQDTPRGMSLPSGMQQLPADGSAPRARTKPTAASSGKPQQGHAGPRAATKAKSKAQAVATWHRRSTKTPKPPPAKGGRGPKALAKCKARGQPGRVPKARCKSTGRPEAHAKERGLKPPLAKGSPEADARGVMPAKRRRLRAKESPRGAPQQKTDNAVERPACEAAVMPEKPAVQDGVGIDLSKPKEEAAEA